MQTQLQGSVLVHPHHHHALTSASAFIISTNCSKQMSASCGPGEASGWYCRTQHRVAMTLLNLKIINPLCQLYHQYECSNTDLLLQARPKQQKLPVMCPQHWKYSPPSMPARYLALQCRPAHTASTLLSSALPSVLSSALPRLT